MNNNAVSAMCNLRCQRLPKPSQSATTAIGLTAQKRSNEKKEKEKTARGSLSARWECF